jgi:hypothetical protein
MKSWTFRALDCRVVVRCSTEELDYRLEVLLGSYEPIADDAECQYRYELSQDGEVYQLRRNGEIVYDEGDEHDLLGFFQLDLYRRIVEQSSEGRWLLHAAALHKAGKVLVLTGPSNAGKSTLCRALMCEGWSYLTEEIVSLGDDAIDALRRPLHFDAEEQFEIHPEFEPILLREEPKPTWIAKPPPPPPPKELQLAGIVRIQYRPDEPTELRRLDDAEARNELWACRMNTGIEVAQLASRIIARVPCYRLDAADVESALAALTGVWTDE